MAKAWCNCTPLEIGVACDRVKEQGLEGIDTKSDLIRLLKHKRHQIQEDTLAENLPHIVGKVPGSAYNVRLFSAVAIRMVFAFLQVKGLYVMTYRNHKYKVGIWAGFFHD
jgi:hypothetical protein